MVRRAPEASIEDATRILAHYFTQATPDMDSYSRADLRAEMRDVVRAIVDATILTIDAQYREIKGSAV